MIGDRIREAREAAKLSLRDLADKVREADEVDGLGYTVIQKIEAGKRKVASHELVALATQLGTTTAWLLGRDDRSAALSLAARVSEVIPASAYGEVVERAVQILEAEDLLSRVAGPLPVVRRPAVLDDASRSLPVSRAAGVQLAAAARDVLGLGTAPVADLELIIENQFGAHVASEPLQGGHGFCVMSDGAAVVIVNSTDTFGRQRFTMAHELCHLIVGDLDTYEMVGETGHTTGAEGRADAFAAAFLAPELGVRAAVADRPVDGRVAAELSHRFGMSLQAMCYRLKEFRMISAADADEIIGHGLKSLSYTANLGDSWQELRRKQGVSTPPARLADQAVRAYSAGRIGIGLVAQVFGQPNRAELRLTLEQQGYAPVPLGDASHLA